VMPVSHGLADGLPLQSKASGAPPLILVQSNNQDLCQRRCEFDYQTCVQIVRENSSNGNYGGYQLIPEGRAQEFNQYAYEGCATKRRYCYRNCDRP
jgi:hypothetical protein